MMLAAVGLLALACAGLWRFRRSTPNPAPAVGARLPAGSDAGAPGAGAIAGPSREEALAAAFGPRTRPDAGGSFVWTVPGSAFRSREDQDFDDVRGRPLAGRILRLARITRPDASSPPPVGVGVGNSADAGAWLLVTASAAMLAPDGDGNGNGKPSADRFRRMVISAFVLTQNPDQGRAWRAVPAMPLLTRASGVSGFPRLRLVRVGPKRQALGIFSVEQRPGMNVSTQDYWAIGATLSPLLDQPLFWHADQTAHCAGDVDGDSQGLPPHHQPPPPPCGYADVDVHFVPARAGAGEVDDPAQWVLEAEGSYSDPAMAAMGRLPQGQTRLPYRAGHYRLPAGPP